MRIGFTEDEYQRVRDWLLSAIAHDPTKITEETLLEKLRSDEWKLVTTEHAASVLQLCTVDGEKIANVLLIGGEKNKSLREIMKAHLVVGYYLKALGYTKIVGQPRKEFNAVLQRNGFQKGQEELFKEL